MKIDVQRELYITAPEGMAVYVQNPSYTSAEGTELIEAAKHEAMHIDEKVGKVYYHPRIFPRLSTDNGKTWADLPDVANETAEKLAGTQRNVPMYVLDPTRDRLIAFHSTYDVDPDEPLFQGGNLRQRTYRMHYQVSDDHGKSWSDARQVIDSREGYDDVRWGPGLEHGENGATADLFAWTWMDDGSLVFGLSVSNAPSTATDGHAAEGCWAVVYVRAEWADDGETLDFRIGEFITVGPEQAAGGCCEPAVVSLGGSRLFNAMRCQGDEERGIYATRFSTVSDDYGMTWSTPAPLTYDDGSSVWTPASLSQFVRLKMTGKVYWLADILDAPVYGQMPRYPLCIAEFDIEKCCIVRSSVCVIQDLPEGAPEQRRYTNWGSYEERGTGDLILTLPEQPMLMDYTAMTRPEEFTADCLRYRISVSD